MRKRVTGAQWAKLVAQMLERRGWRADGETMSETVRVGTLRAPVSCGGKAGGEIRTFGGRQRMCYGDQRVTIGPRTVCFYTRGQRDFVSLSTRTTEAIDAEAQRRERAGA